MLQRAVEEAVVVFPAPGRLPVAVAVPSVPSLLRQGRGAAAAPPIGLVSEAAPGRAVVPLVGSPGGRLGPASSGAEGAGEIFQLVQGAGAASPAQRLPVQVL